MGASTEEHAQRRTILSALGQVDLDWVLPARRKAHPELWDALLRYCAAARANAPNHSRSPVAAGCRGTLEASLNGFRRPMREGPPGSSPSSASMADGCGSRVASVTLPLGTTRRTPAAASRVGTRSECGGSAQLPPRAGSVANAPPPVSVPACAEFSFGPHGPGLCGGCSAPPPHEEAGELNFGDGGSPQSRGSRNRLGSGGSSTSNTSFGGGGSSSSAPLSWPAPPQSANGQACWPDSGLGQGDGADPFGFPSWPGNGDDRGCHGGESSPQGGWPGLGMPPPPPSGRRRNQKGSAAGLADRVAADLNSAQLKGMVSNVRDIRQQFERGVSAAAQAAGTSGKPRRRTTDGTRQVKFSQFAEQDNAPMGAPVSGNFAANVPGGTRIEPPSGGGGGVTSCGGVASSFAGVQASARHAARSMGQRLEQAQHEVAQAAADAALREVTGGRMTKAPPQATSAALDFAKKHPQEAARMAQCAAKFAR